MIAAGLSGRGASGHRGRSAFKDRELKSAQDRLLDLGNAQCTSHFSNLDGRRLHYLASGSGEPLLLLHGAGGGAANWYRLISALSQRWRVIAPDLPGFGFSDSIDAEGPLGHQVAGIIARWLGSIGIDSTHVIGTSFGGLVALRLPQYFPTQKLIAIDSVGIAQPMPWLLRLATLPGVARLVVSPTRPGTRAMLRHALTNTRLPPQHEDALVDYLYASARRGDAAAMARAFVRFADLRGQRDVLSSAELHGLGDRLLLVWGERDNFLPVQDVARTAALAGCPEVRIIPAAGHSPNWENPEALLKMIHEFLET